MWRTSDEWIEAYKTKGALWIHDGNPKRPHALLTSGNHSDGFFNSKLVTEDPFLLQEASADLVELLVQNCLDLELVDRVVGPATGATKLAEEGVAPEIGKKRGRPCLSAYTEKDTDKDGKKRMIFINTSIRDGETVLLCEDVRTTGESVGLTAQAVINAGGTILPYVALLVNRSGEQNSHGVDFIALINRHMQSWRPEECPLCPKGSEAIRPEGTENWQRLNATY
jgi:orotate phosphoribosyltransferase